METENELLKYVHIEQFGTDEVDGINVETCHVFPKIDGTNASVWKHSELEVACGSRNLFLAPGTEDNGGFRQFGSKNIPQLLGMAFHDLVTENLWEALKKHKNPKVDFKTLQFCSINRVKELL